MNTSYAKSNLRGAAIACAAVALLLCLSQTLMAQRTLPENVPQQGDPDRQVRSQEIEASRTQRDPKLIMAEVNEDFSRLREISEAIKQALKSTAAPDYKRMSDSSAEIKKRATRLKANLIFPPPPKNENRPKSPDLESDGFQPLLAAMDKRLTSFLTNPVFTDTGDLDAQLANRARYDLDDILKLSDRLRKSADKMSKTAGKS